MAKPIYTRPGPPEAEKPQNMHRRWPLPIYPSRNILARQQPAFSSCAGDETPSTLIYKTTITRALPLSTSTYERFFTDSQTDKTTTITQTVVEAARRTTIETPTITTTFCLPRSISSAISANPFPTTEATVTSIPSLTSTSRPTDPSAVPTSSGIANPTPPKPSKTPAIVAAAVLPVVAFIIIMLVFCCLRGQKAKKDDAAVDEVELEAMREEDNLAEAERIARSQTEGHINVGGRAEVITQDLINARLRWEHRGLLPAHGFGQQARSQLQTRPPGVLDLGTTLPNPGASSGIGTVVPDDSISVVQGLNPPNVIDHALDSLVAATPQDEEDLEDLEGQDIQSPSQDSQVIETMEHVYQTQTERAKRIFSLHGGNVMADAERAQPDRDCMYTEEFCKLQRRSLMGGIVRESRERAERQWREDEARAQQRALDEAEKILEQETRQRDERSREGARQRARRHIRGLGVTDTNMTDFDVDAVNDQQANQPPRRHQPRQGGQGFGPYPLFISQATPGFGVYGSSSPNPRTRTNLYERQIGEGSSGGAGPGPQTLASRERRGEDDELPHAWLDVGPSSDGN